MSSPLLWIIFPGIAGAVLLAFLNFPRVVKWSGFGIGLGLATLAGILPIGEPLTFLPGELILSPEFAAVGRKLLLTRADRPIILLIFAGFSSWSLIVDLRYVSIRIVPLGLIAAGLILAALAVEPIFYGAILLAFLALLYTLILTPPTNPTSQGVLRFLIHQVLGTMLILFAAWMFSWIDLNSVEDLLLVRAAVIFGAGFSFLLAIFPFSSWILMLAEENHPFLTAFVLNTYLTAALLFGVRFLSSAGWLPALLEIQGAIRWVGVMMVVLGGISAFFTNHLGKLLGYQVVVDIGRSLLAVSLLGEGFPILFHLIIIQTLALSIWAVSLTLLTGVTKALDYPSLTGSGRQWPMVVLGVIAGQVTMAGLPLLAGFPATWSLAVSLQSGSPLAAGALLVGVGGLLAGAVRTTGYLFRSAGEEDVLMISTPFTRGVLAAGICISLLLGMYPDLLSEVLTILAGGFSP